MKLIRTIHAIIIIDNFGVCQQNCTINNFVLTWTKKRLLFDSYFEYWRSKLRPNSLRRTKSISGAGNAHL